METETLKENKKGTTVVAYTMKLNAQSIVNHEAWMKNNDNKPVRINLFYLKNVFCFIFSDIQAAPK